VGKLGIAVVEDRALYQVGELELIGKHENRKLAPNIDHGGNVHLNILDPGARAGNHYHETLEEFFVNTGPGPLILHLRHRDGDEVEVVEMSPVSKCRAPAYRAKLCVSHIVENPNPQQVVLVIVVDRDNPDDICACPVYPA
jgi:uncharacterized cupin superfamily protein